MKIGIDFHGVMNRDPETFQKLMIEWINKGHEVHVMTGSQYSTFLREFDELRKKLKSQDWPYTHFFSVSTYLQQHFPDVMDFSDPEHPWTENKKLWDSVKGTYAREQKLDLVIDDTLDYIQYFTTPFIYYKKPKDLIDSK